MTYSWFKVNLTEFARVWSSSAIENVDLLGSEDEPYSITVTHKQPICNQIQYIFYHSKNNNWTEEPQARKKQRLEETDKKN